MNSINVGIYVFEQVEVLDFAGPFEVFSTANRVHQRTHPDTDIFNVFTVTDKTENGTPAILSARAGFLFAPHHHLDQHPPIDLLIIPGGVVEAELEKSDLLLWIKAVAATSRITASICTGAFLLAQAGLLNGGPVTTHWEDIADLRKRFPALLVEENARFIDNGQIVTSAGISAGIDMSLHLVARLAGEALAAKTARQMEYEWRKTH